MSQLIPQDIIDKIKENIPIEDVIGKSVALKKRGANLVGLCPFHSDRTPSMYVSPSKQIFKCFACGEAGHVISFVMKDQSLSFTEACRSLAKDYNIDIPEKELSSEELVKAKQKESMHIVLDKAQEQFAMNLNQSFESQTYLKDRKLNAETIKLFGAGYATNSNQVTNNFVERGYSFDVLLSAGLTKVKEQTGYKHDIFFNRIMFPFYNLSGRIVGFTGRTLDKNATDYKYFNSPDTDLFSKGEVLFGLHQAKKAISRTGKVYFVEGQFDVMSFYQNGLQNTVCSSGTALTEKQVKLLRRFADTIILILDADRAGCEAALKNIQLFLSYGFDVRGCILPEGEDPDTFAQKIPAGKKLPKEILSMEKEFHQYAYELCQNDIKTGFETARVLDLICDCVAVIPDKVIYQEYIGRVASLFKLQPSDVSERIKPKKTIKIEEWKDGFYGVDEAIEIMENQDSSELCTITFDQKKFIELFEKEQPIVFASGVPSTSDVQLLRTKINKFKVEQSRAVLPTGKDEPKGLLTLKALFKEGFDLSVFIEVKAKEKEKAKIEYRIFCDFYVAHYGRIINDDKTGIIKETATERCLEVIANSSNTSRSMMINSYAGYMGITKSALEKLLKPLLAKKKDKSEFDAQRLNSYANLKPIDTDSIPAYVLQDKGMHDEYIRSGYYPWLDIDNRPVAYMFKNQNGGGHACLSDFYIEPLLHVTDDIGGNKRVVKLSHIQKQYDKYVEFPSNVFASLQTLNVRLVEEGPYNFDGTAYQFKKIWRNISYGFTTCTELKIFGQQPEEFWAFSNAILHKADKEYVIQDIDPLGVVTHNSHNFYLPAFSNINLKTRLEGESNKQARNIMYKDIAEKSRLSFSEWAKLMDDVYCTNNNGKWATLFAITAAFRDFIFKERSFFTALFFIGPTGSGKTQVATSVRNLFMASTTPSFNLNTGTDAAFFMMLENFRNIVVLMEEYNDKDISQAKFQGLKSATLDGEGKIKVKDAGSKTMDSSVINASIVILGQEASQQDDGALSNRCILCDVPYRPDPNYTEEETAIYNKLKDHEKIGLCNVLIDILKLRPTFEKHYLHIFDSEVKKLKESIKIELTNTEGLARIINAVALMTSTCKLLEEFTDMKLPFTYETFSKLAGEKILAQLDRISSSNKLATYFKTISSLITDRAVKIGRELKISVQKSITVKLSGRKTEPKHFDTPTKVLFIDFNEVYTKYKRTVGEKESLSEASLRSYFDSCKAYIGQCKSTQFKWKEPIHTERGGLIPSNDVNADGTIGQVDIRAQLEMKEETKITSAYMFNYESLVELMDVDFERNQSAPEDQDLPF